MLLASFVTAVLASAIIWRVEHRCPGPSSGDPVLWQGDAEEGDLSDWTTSGDDNAGGGVFNTGGADVSVSPSSAVARSGSFSVEATITNAYRAEDGAKAVRLMRWTDRPWPEWPWQLGGRCFPGDAHYSVWMFFPENYNPNKYEPWSDGANSWWNVFQFKSADEDGESQPVWTLQVGHDDGGEQMQFYLFSKPNSMSVTQPDPLEIPVGQWMHVEAHYVQAESGVGSITIWQDGQEILRAEDVTTKLDGHLVWGIGNYTDHVVGGTDGRATIYFDDAAVSRVRLSGG